MHDLRSADLCSCVVTGSASGIGAATVAAFVAAGWFTVGVDREPSSGPGSVTGSGQFAAVRGDVREPPVHREAADVAESARPLGAWVNCAGYNILGTVADLDEAELRRGVDVNLLGYFFGTAEAVRRYLRRGAGRAENQKAIVNISSVQASVGFPGFAAYAMCKGGIEALSRQVAAEYLRDGIRCNVVAPGHIDSPMNDRLLAASDDPETLRRRWAAISPIGRAGQPDDVAQAVLFLATSGLSSFVTGQRLGVDGGALTLARGYQ